MSALAMIPDKYGSSESSESSKDVVKPSSDYQHDQDAHPFRERVLGENELRIYAEQRGGTNPLDIASWVRG